MPKRVDIILPNYNKAEYIEECLDSLQAQTHENWRCIVVDGYSDDGSWEYLKERAREDSRFELRQLARIGLYASWNYGLEQVESPYFAVLTSDDVWESRWLEAAVKSLESRSGAVAAAARTHYLDGRSNPGTVTKLNRFGEQLMGTAGSGASVWRGVDCSVSCFFAGSVFTSIHSLVMSSSILNHMRFATDVGSAADWGWATELGLHGDILYHPEVKAYWRRHPGQASSAEFDKREEVGRGVLQMYRALRTRIARSLNDDREQIFHRRSEEHLETYLPYFFKRPSLEAVYESPKQGLGRMFSLMREYPSLALRELSALVRGSEWHINEVRLDAAREVLRK
jgi:glycosyltransferase involved in cell wall biosynthesis